MRILIDECLPRDLKRLLAGHESSTVQEMGWSGRKNGELLSLANGSFHVFLTIDQGLQHQQNLQGRNISVLVIEAASNKIEDLSSAIPEILLVIPSLRVGPISKSDGTLASA